MNHQIGNMLNGVFGASPLQMAFGGGMKHISSSRARTYYFFGSSRAEAEDWCAAIGNNITAMSAEAGNVGGTFGGIDVLKNSASMHCLSVIDLLIIFIYCVFNRQRA